MHCLVLGLKAGKAFVLAQGWNGVSIDIDKDWMYLFD
jgi:hypothetical protein